MSDLPITVVADESRQMSDIVRVAITAEENWRLVVCVAIEEWTYSRLFRSAATRLRWGAEMLYSHRGMLCTCQHRHA